MSNLSEEIINRYLTGQCSEEELIEVNAWMKESEENARQLFRMEEIYHLGKFDQYTDEQRILRAEKQLYKKLDEEKGKHPGFSTDLDNTLERLFKELVL